MSSRLNIRVDDETDEKIDRVRRDWGHENTSEASRAVIAAGLEQMGYGRRPPSTWLRRAVSQVSTGLLYAGAALVGVSLVAPVEFRFAAICIITAGLALFALDRAVLASVEPGLTARLPTIEVDR